MLFHEYIKKQIFIQEPNTIDLTKYIIHLKINKRFII